MFYITRRTALTLGTALLSFALLTGCGVGGSSTPAATAPASHAGHHKKTGKHAKKKARHAYRVTSVASGSLTIKAGHHTYTVSASVPVYFEGSAVSESTWVKPGERVRLLGGAQSPTAVLILPTVQGKVSAITSQSVTVSTASGKSLTLAIPTGLLSTDISMPLQSGQAFVGIALHPSSGQTLIGVASRPSVATATVVSVSGQTVVVSVSGKNSSPLPFLGPHALLSKLKAGRHIKVMLGQNGVPLAAL